MNLMSVGDGKVVLIAGGGKIYTDIAAKFVKSERSLDEIIASPYDKRLVYNIINSGHKAAVEFDYFIFGVEGYSRVTETQLVRKRIASYIIKSGRTDKKGKRSFDMVLPKGIRGLSLNFEIPIDRLRAKDGTPLGNLLKDLQPPDVDLQVEADLILRLIEAWYARGVEKSIPEEDLRYLKPQATEFKGLIGMNAHALMDWFAIRCCKNAQAEIRDMANKMLALCKEAAPDLFAQAGPNCRVLGYCPENDFQHKDCRGRVPTRNEALEILKRNY
ncbi:MAG TPA: FAD-dependent thymidylate synthase [Firmicutes bacterium]|nr:FAD-dependent thymidylate synthase [Bacillota bacterium]